MSAACPTYGFHVAFDFRTDVAPEAREAAWGAWIDLLDSQGLECREADARRRGCMVVSVAAQATDNDRAALSAWLAARTELAAWRMGELVDLQHS